MYIRIKKYLVLTTPDHLGNIRESWVYSLDKPISEGLTAARGNPFTVTTIRKNK